MTFRDFRSKPEAGWVSPGMAEDLSKVFEVANTVGGITAASPLVCSYIGGFGIHFALDESNLSASRFDTTLTAGSVLTPTALAANTNDYEPDGGSTCHTWRLSASAACNLTGMGFESAGMLRELINVGSFTITLKNDVTSTAAKRFLMDADYSLAAATSALFWYDTTSARWRLVATGKAASAGGATSPLTTKGDIWVYSTLDTRLGVGSNGQVLLAASGETTGLKWGAVIVAAAGSGGAGGGASLTGGVGDTNAAGGGGSLAGGAGNGSGTGGAATLTGGAGGATGGGGAATLAGGAAGGGNNSGGAGSLTGGAGAGTGAGGAASLAGGISGSGATGNGGAASLTGGAAASTNGSGGAGSLVGGAATGTGTGGAITITGGASAGASGTGGSVTIGAGAANGGTVGGVNVAGSTDKLGFYGVTPITRAASPDIGTGLVNLGLVSGTPTFGAANLTGTIAQARLPNTTTIPPYGGFWKTSYACPMADGTTSALGVNIAAPSAIGTASAVTNVRGHYVGFASSALTNSDAGVFQANTHVHLDQTPVLTWIMEFPNSADFNANSRTWVGVTDNAITLKTQDTLNNLSGLAFRVSTGTSDTNWQCTRNDGGATAPAVTDSGVAVAANTKYVLQIDATDNTSIKFYINGTLVATMTSGGGDLPATSTRMQAICSTRTLTNTTKNQYFGLFRQDYIN